MLILLLASCVDFDAALVALNELLHLVLIRRLHVLARICVTEAVDLLRIGLV